MSIWKFQDLSIKLLSIFFFGMIGQFLAHTIVMYGLKLPQSFEFIRLWKEIVVIILWIGATILLWNNNDYKQKFLNNKTITYNILVIIISFIISMTNSLLIHHQSIITFLVSAKFNYIPLIIFCCWLLVSQILQKEQHETVLDTIVKTIKYVLVFSLIWYGILHTIPNILDRIGFAQPGDSIEWTANTPPPSLYLTEFYSWYVRNQWPFWWPLSLWFYLIGLWPLFFTKVLYKQKLSDTRWRRILYISIVMSTYSRAAWWMFFLSSLLIALILYRKYTKYIIWWGIISIVLLFLYIKWWGTSEMFLRTWSDKWHLEYFTQWMELVSQNRLRWLGASSVWPWSNHIEWITKVFNPENQYMQIWLEYGLLWLLWWLFAYITIAKDSIKKSFSLWFSNTEYNKDDILFIWIGISIVSLWIGGMVLHPFADSSSIYPFMMMAWLLLGNYRENKEISKKISLHTSKINFAFLKNWKIWTIIISCLFTIQTIIVSGLHIIDSNIIISTLRDIVFWWSILISCIYYKNYIVWFIKRYYGIVIPIVILTSLNIIYFIIYNQDKVHTIAGIKYDIFFFRILWWSLWIGYLLQKLQKWDIILSYIKWFAKFIIILLWIWVIRQISKTLYPELFTHYLWFNSPNDFIPFTKPPIYYITGSGGIQRLSGLFVWPNTLWFFLILISSFLYYSYKEFIIQRKNFRIILLYVIVCISTLSRWVIIWLTIQSYIVIFLNNYIIWKDTFMNSLKNNIIKKALITGISTIVWIIAFIWINQRKQESNTERFWALDNSLHIVSEISLLGKWPWYVWPAQHYEKDYINHQKNTLSMLENIYLQITINQGILWILSFFMVFAFLIQYHLSIKTSLQLWESNMRDYNISIVTQYLGIWLISLLSIGRFLHIFIDSMVNYLFFILYWVCIWYSYKIKE